MRRFVVAMVATGLFVSAAAPTFADEKIAQRKSNQQKRIGNGVKNGSLTPRETSKLENKEAGLNGEIRADRKENGGKLTGQEKRQVNRQQNRLSGDIYRDKHNAQTQPKP